MSEQRHLSDAAAPLDLVPIAQIADQLGHADPAMTARVYLGRDLHGDKSDIARHL